MQQNRLGNGRRLGSLVLAWDDVKRGAADPSDGTNLVLHEFAHQLDFEDNASDGGQRWPRGLNIWRGHG